MKKIFNLFLTFFKIGLFTFGGGYAMISTIREIIVEKKNWITDDELMQIITIAESTPGPIAINMATYIGYKQKKALGSVLATLGVVLPSFVIIFLISLFLERFMEFKVVQYAFVGINAAVAFLIIKTGISLLLKVEKKILPIGTFIIVFSLMIILDILSLKFSSLYYIIIGGIIGIIYYAIVTPKKEVK
jgi:chromate transporter